MIIASGTSSVTVRATDAAGNQATAVATVTTSDAPLEEPTSLRVTPQGVKLPVGKKQRFTLVDNLGRIPADAVWTIDNTTIATLTTADGPELTAISAGQVTVTATWRGLTATSEVTIVSGALPIGTVLWTAPPVHGRVEHIAQGAAGADGRSLIYVLEHTGSWEEVSALLRAFDSDGREQWATSMGGEVLQLSGDLTGGVVALLRGWYPYLKTVVAFTPDGAARTIGAAESEGFAIHPDGAVYVATTTQLVGLDIGLGGGRHVPIDANMVGIPTVMEDGSVAVPLAVDDVPTEPEYGPGQKLQLLISKPDGSSQLHLVTSFYNSALHRHLQFSPFKAIPAGQNRIVVAYDHHWASAYHHHHGAVHSIDLSGPTPTVSGGQGLAGLFKDPRVRSAIRGAGELVLSDDGEMTAQTYLERPDIYYPVFDEIWTYRIVPMVGATTTHHMRWSIQSSLH